MVVQRQTQKRDRVERNGKRKGSEKTGLLRLGLTRT